jgi:polyisoprenoid-binding protein YceI
MSGDSVVKRLMLVLAGLGLAAALPAIAQQLPRRPPGAADVKRIVPGRYVVDPQHSQVTFSVNHLGFSTYRGMFGGLTGSIVINSRAPAKTKVLIDIPIKSVTTTVKELDAHLLAPGFFDAARHPVGHFESTSIRPAGKRVRIAGKLTLKGVTRPVVLDAALVGAGVMMGKRTIGFDATTTIRRSAFGINEGIPLIPDVVPLVISVAFEKPER